MCKEKSYERTDSSCISQTENDLHAADFGGIGYLLFSSTITKFHFTEGLLSFPKAFVWIGENLIPDELAIRRFPKILDKLIETVLLSVAVTVLAAIFAFLSACLAQKQRIFHVLSINWCE